jgi:lipopolysaccharide transport system permease protein
LIRRDVVGRYRGSTGGLIWSFVNPLLMLAVYTFVFSVVFKARWGTTEGANDTQFAIVLFMGLIVHGLFAECVNRAPALVLSNVNYVKRVVFPLEVLAVVALGSALFHMVVSIVILLVFQLVFAGMIDWHIVWLPIVLLPLAILTLGVAWFLAATSVYVRDVAQTTGILTTMLLFLSPVFYPVSALPEQYRPWLNLSPMTFIIEQARGVTLAGKNPDLVGLGMYLVAAITVFCAGFWWFQRTRPGFADVI